MRPEPQHITHDGTQARLWPGTGCPVLLMLHGIGSDMTSFDPLVEHLPEAWTLIAWNAPGYGQSKPVVEDHPKARAYADRLNGFMAELNLGPVVLLGHSLGTLIATEFAALWPERTRALILLACAQGYGAEPGVLPAKAQARLDDLDRLGAAEFARTRAPNLFYHPEAYPAACKSAIAAMSRITRRGYGQAVHMLACGDQAGRAAQVSCPTLVMVGAKDRITPPIQSETVHKALTQAAPDLPHHREQVENAGHALHQQAPGLVAASIAKACDDHLLVQGAT